MPVLLLAIYTFVVAADVFRDFPARVHIVGLGGRPRFRVGLGIFDREIVRQSVAIGAMNALIREGQSGL